jgi:hypothetical protein
LFYVFVFVFVCLDRVNLCTGVGIDNTDLWYLMSVILLNSKIEYIRILMYRKYESDVIMPVL